MTRWANKLDYTCLYGHKSVCKIFFCQGGGGGGLVGLLWFNASATCERLHAPPPLRMMMMMMMMMMIMMKMMACPFHWWRKPEYPKNKNDPRQVTTNFQTCGLGPAPVWNPGRRGVKRIQASGEQRFRPLD